MKWRSETAKPIAQMDITPLTGVMLLLLIILMATATIFTREPDPAVELPAAASSTTQPSGPGEIVVAVDHAGALYVQETPVSAENFAGAALAAARALDADHKVVLLRADADTPYGRVIWVMDSLRLVGLRHVSLATQPHQEPVGRPTGGDDGDA